jgi:CheY-like chemotaxis protein
MDGITACTRIRELQDAGEIVAHVPIISVSANARSEKITSAREAGMDDSISKPFRIRELLPKLEELARRWG